MAVITNIIISILIAYCLLPIATAIATGIVFLLRAHILCMNKSEYVSINDILYKRQTTGAEHMQLAPMAARPGAWA